MSEEERRRELEQAEAEMLRAFIFADGSPARRVNDRGVSQVSEHLLALQARRETLDVSRLGIQDRGIRDIVLADRAERKRDQLVSACVAYCAAQGLLDGIGSVDESLTLRELNPMWDFAAKLPQDLVSFSHNANEILLQCPAEWRWPVWGFYEKANEWVNVCQRRESWASVMLLYGLRNLGTELYTSRIRFMRGNVKILEIGDISDILHPHTDYLMATPVMFKRGDQMRIDIHANSDAIHHCDHIRPLGFVCEPNGTHESG